MSHTRAPLARSMKSGSPPTLLNARTGEFTPPGINFCAFSKAALLFSIFLSITLYLLPSQPILPRMISNDHIGTGPFDRSQDLLNHPLLIYPSIGCCRLHHRELSTYIVGNNRYIEVVLHPSDYIQIAQSRLDHNHIGTLQDVLLYLAQSFIAVGRIHLVTAAVAKLGGTLCCVTKRPVKSTGKFRRISHYGQLGKATFIEGLPYGGYPTVHHVAGGDHIGTGLGQGQRLPGQRGYRKIVVHLPIDQRTAMPMGGIFTIADVGNNEHLQFCFTQSFNGTGHYGMVTAGDLARFILLFGDPEQQDAAHPGICHQIAHLFYQLINTQLKVSRHRGNRVTHPASKTHKVRHNQVGGLHFRLSYHLPQKRRPPQSPQSRNWIHSTTFSYTKAAPLPDNTLQPKGSSAAVWTSVHFPEQAALPPDNFLHPKGSSAAVWTSVHFPEQAALPPDNFLPIITQDFSPGT